MHFKVTKMDVDINQNPLLTSFEEFKALSLQDRRQVLFSMLKEILPIESKVQNLENQVQALERRVTMIEDQQIFQAFNYQILENQDEFYDPLFQPSASLIKSQRKLSQRVNLNVGGQKFQALWKCLANYPNTRLGKLACSTTHEEILECCDTYSLKNNEYFFDIHPRSFGSVLNFYATGQLHLMDAVCVMSLNEDLQYWGLDGDVFLEQCCHGKFTSKRDATLKVRLTK